MMQRVSPILIVGCVASAAIASLTVTTGAGAGTAAQIQWADDSYSAKDIRFIEEITQAAPSSPVVIPNSIPSGYHPKGSWDFGNTSNHRTISYRYYPSDLSYAPVVTLCSTTGSTRECVMDRRSRITSVDGVTVVLRFSGTESPSIESQWESLKFKSLAPPSVPPEGSERP